jgi:hypothetical protein
LLQKFEDVQIELKPAGKLDAGVLGKIQELGGRVFNLPSGGIVRAEVTVPLSNIAHFDVLRDINIALPGATAIGTGAWNAAGAKTTGALAADSVCSRVKRAVPTAAVAGVINPILTVMKPFEDKTPKLGLILPDYVPPGSVRTNDGRDNPVPLSAQNGNPC